MHELRQQVRVQRRAALGVDDDLGQRGLAGAIADLDDLRHHAGAELDALGAAREHQRLALGQHDLLARRVVLDAFPHAVVEHRAVLQHLDEHRALVLVGLVQDRAHQLGVGIGRPRDERRAGAERERDRVQRVIDRAGRRRRRAGPDRRGRRVLALGEAVDLVVEQQDLEVHVAAQRMDHVVAADRQPVAVAGDHPDIELGARDLEPRRDRRRAAVDRVEAVGVHVVREPARAADAADEHGVLALDADLRERALHGREDRVVAAARAPPHVLVGLEVLLGQLDLDCFGHGFPGFLYASA